MKVNLNPKEQKQLNDCINNNLVRKWLKLRESLKFEIGDVLIKKIRSGDKWVDENIASQTKMPQRYVYIHEDEEGIGYFKKLLISNGSLGAELFSITDFDFEHNRFEVDPEYAEHTLLGAEFDIKDIKKKANEGKRIATKMNRKIGIKATKFTDLNKFFEKVQAAGVFYYTYDWTGRSQYELKITAMEKITIKELERQQSLRYGSKFTDRFVAGTVDADYTYKLSIQGKYGKEERYAYDYQRYILYEIQPAKAEDSK